jgi:hypothetical protein
MIDDDLDVYLADHGTECSVGETGFLGIFDTPDENLSLPGGAGAQSTMSTLLMKTSDVVALGIKRDTSINVGTITYTARNPVKVGDGAFSNVPLTLVRA